MPPGLYNAAINGQQAVVRMWLMFVQSPNFALQHIFMIHTRWLGMKKSCQKLIELKGLDPHVPQSCSPCFHISVPLVPMSPYQCSPGPPCLHISGTLLDPQVCQKDAITGMEYTCGVNPTWVINSVTFPLLNFTVIYTVPGSPR